METFAFYLETSQHRVSRARQINGTYYLLVEGLGCLDFRQSPLGFPAKPPRSSGCGAPGYQGSGVCRQQLESSPALWCQSGRNPGFGLFQAPNLHRRQSSHAGQFQDHHMLDVRGKGFGVPANHGRCNAGLGEVPHTQRRVPGLQRPGSKPRSKEGRHQCSMLGRG
jgi:hypothetical protein